MFIEQIQFKDFGTALRLEHENMEMVVTTDVGPRILFFGAKGGENLLHIDDLRSQTYTSAKHTEMFGADNPYYFYGGHRVWASPEHDPHSTYPDNDPVSVEISGDSILFEAPPQKRIGLQLALKIVTEPGAFRIINMVRNLSDSLKTLAAWGITQLAAGGHLIFPQVTTDTGLLPNRHLTIWPYTSMTDPRVGFGDQYIVIAHDPKDSRPYKIGTNNKDGWMAYLGKGYLFHKSFPWENNKIYPDNNVNFEVYLNDSFVEGECLSDLKVLATGQQVRGEEVWRIRKLDTAPDFTDESTLAATLNPFGDTDVQD